MMDFQESCNISDPGYIRCTGPPLLESVCSFCGYSVNERINIIYTIIFEILTYLLLMSCGDIATASGITQKKICRNDAI